MGLSSLELLRRSRAELSGHPNLELRRPTRLELVGLSR
jgi:hypothetical protein